MFVYVVRYSSSSICYVLILLCLAVAVHLLGIRGVEAFRHIQLATGGREREREYENHLSFQKHGSEAEGGSFSSHSVLVYRTYRRVAVYNTAQGEEGEENEEE